MNPGARWRRRLFDLHGALGLFVGFVLAFVSLSGSVAVFRREIDWLTTPALRVAPARRSVSLHAVQRSANAVAARLGAGNLWMFRVPEGPRFAYSLLYRHRDTVTEVFVEPSTGNVTGARVVGLTRSSIADVVRQVHVRLLLGVWGRAFVGMCGLALVLMALSGLVLSRREGRTVATGRVALTRWHRRVGLWGAAFHLVSGLSGAVLGLEVVPGIVRDLRAPAKVAVAPVERRVDPVHRHTLDEAVAWAEQHLPTMTTRALRMRSDGRVVVHLDAPSPWIARGASDVIVDLDQAAILSSWDARLGDLGSRAYDTLDPIHFGYFGERWGTLPGYLIRIVWCLSGLTPAALFVLGFAMWRRRVRRGSQPRFDLGTTLSHSTSPTGPCHTA